MDKEFEDLPADFANMLSPELLQGLPPELLKNLPREMKDECCIM